MQNSKGKIVALILGTVMSVVVLEVSLRVVGVVYSLQTKQGHPVKREPGTYVILCLGDSFTEGSGAPKGKGYPVQLEDLFRKKCPEKKIKVINKGASTLNTGEILEGFDETVNTVNPSVITILAGAANGWNSYGYGKYLSRNGWKERISDFLYRIKVFKLIKLFMFDWRNKWRRSFEKSDLTPTRSKISPKAGEFCTKGWKSQQEGKYDEAVLWFKEQIKNDPLNDDGYKNLCGAYYLMRDMEGQRQMYRKLVELDPGNVGNWKAMSIFLKDPQRNKEDYQFAQRYVRKNPVVGDILKSRTNWNKYIQEQEPWITHDIEEMIRRAQERGIKVILQSYPSYDGVGKGGNYEYFSGLLRGVAKKMAVLFVDHEQIFEGIFLKGKNRDDYFEAAKVHCNEKGYGVMAENIYNCIIAHNVISGVGLVDKRELSEP